MDNAFDVMTQAIKDAEQVLRVADRKSYELARILRGRLRSVDTSTPCAL